MGVEESLSEEELIEGALVEKAIEMMDYARAHSFQGITQKADRDGFQKLNCDYSHLQARLQKLNRDYSHLQISLQPNPREERTANFDRARGTITTYITYKMDSRPLKDKLQVIKDELLPKAFLLVTETYLLPFKEKIALRKAL